MEVSLTTTSHILSVDDDDGDDDDGAANSKYSVTCALSLILKATLRWKVIPPVYRRKPSQARFETCLRSVSHPGMVARFKLGQHGSPLLWGLSIIQSYTQEKDHMMKFIKQFKKTLYKSSWNTLQGFGAYDKHFLMTALTFESTLLLLADHKHISPL